MIDYEKELKLSGRRWVRGLYLILGSVCFALGVAGIFLPVLPTVPFILLASVCYARASRRFYNWLMNHRFFGPPLRDWKETKALPLKSKCLAVSTIAISAFISIYFLIPIAAVKWGVGATCTLVACYLIFWIPTRKG